MTNLIMAIIYGAGFGFCAVKWYFCRQENKVIWGKYTFLQQSQSQYVSALDFYKKENAELKKELKDAGIVWEEKNTFDLAKGLLTIPA